MDWLRRNWPDMLIGIALIAVIAGIVATLLTGGSFFPLNSGQPSTPLSTPGVSSPNASSPNASSPNASSPNASSSAQTPDAFAPDAAAPGVQNGAADSPLATPETPGAAAPGSAPQAGDDAAATPGVPAGGSPGAVAVLPPTGNTASGVGAAEGGDAQASAAAPADSAAQGPGGAGAGAPAGSGAAAASAPASSQVPTAPYRVSVGAFSTESNAQRQADAFREAGFPVFIGRQGDLVLVLIGPYDTEQEAQQAVAQIRSGDFGIEPVVYRFQPDGAETAGSTQQSQADPAPVQEPAPAQEEAGAQAEPASPPAAATDSAAEPVSGSAPAASGSGTFLQVGAYATRDSALPQIARLQEMGFEVEERTESGMVKLLVGPFDGDALASARQQLNDGGIEHFAR